MNYLEGLNQPQQEAVQHSDGPLMIIAGAGSGKTRVLTYRTAHLIEKGVDPFQILLLTFTNKAAGEMRRRVESIIGNDAKNLWMGTFHSVFAKILRFDGRHLGYTSDFSIYDADDSKSLIRSIVKERGLDDKIYKANTVFQRISACAAVFSVSRSDHALHGFLLQRCEFNRWLGWFGDQRHRRCGVCFDGFGLRFRSREICRIS